MLFCSCLALWGLRVIAVVAGILFPVVCALGVFVSVSNGERKDHTLLLPILEHGWGPVLNGLVYAGGGFVELIVLVLLQHRLSSRVKLWPLLAYGVFTVLITLGPIFGAITEFGPAEAAKQMASPYEQWRLVKIGQYVEHLDFLSIFQWLAGSCLRISLSVYLFAELLSDRPIVRRCAIAVIMASYVLLSLAPMNDYTFYTWMYEYYVPISFAALLALFVIWAIVGLLADRRREETA